MAEYRNPEQRYGRSETYKEKDMQWNYLKLAKLIMKWTDLLEQWSHHSLSCLVQLPWSPHQPGQESESRRKSALNACPLQHADLHILHHYQDISFIIQTIFWTVQGFRLYYIVPYVHVILPGTSRKTSFLGIHGTAEQEGHPPSPHNGSSLQAKRGAKTLTHPADLCLQAFQLFGI